MVYRNSWIFTNSIQLKRGDSWLSISVDIMCVNNKDQFTHRRHDTTQQHATRPVFRFPYNQMDQFTHMQHDQVWSSRQKAAATKIALEPIFVLCRSDSIKKTAKENSFHRNLTWAYKFMTQE